MLISSCACPSSFYHWYEWTSWSRGLSPQWCPLSQLSTAPCAPPWFSFFALNLDTGVAPPQHQFTSLKISPDLWQVLFRKSASAEPPAVSSPLSLSRTHCNWSSCSHIHSLSWNFPSLTTWFTIPTPPFHFLTWQFLRVDIQCLNADTREPFVCADFRLAIHLSLNSSPLTAWPSLAALSRHWSMRHCSL